MDMLLTPQEVRVLGSLIEKEFSTPEYYPLSLSALVNACNQKSNRDPVAGYDEAVVLRALEGLKGKRLAFQSNAARVAKYEETVLASHNFMAREAAILAELMLRGPQTPGELRSRAERMHAYASPDEFADALEKLESYGYVMRLARQPGRKEARYCHLFSGPPEEQAGGRDEDASPAEPSALAALAEKVRGLEQDLEELRLQFAEFKRQFE